MSLAVALAVAACKDAPPPRPQPTLVQRIDAAIESGAAYLEEVQGPDGAIRSGTYAFFKDGWSLTPLAMMGLYAHPDGAPGARQKGVAFLRGLVVKGGALRGPPDGPRYPMYSLALSILVLNTERDDESRAAREAMAALLRRMQRADDGGWGYEARTGNISATLFAVGALTLSGALADDPALVRARAFVESCQNFEGGEDGDGGFFFSPSEHDGNKAGAVDPAAGPAGPFRSYGSATADGYRALTRLGAAREEPRLRAAGAWLEKRFRADANPGDFLPMNEVRRASSYYYWAWTAAHALRALGKPVLATERGEVRWAEALAEELLRRQRPDGSFANPASEMREDDPIVATSFALAALGVTRSVLAGAYRSHAGAR